MKKNRMVVVLVSLGIASILYAGQNGEGRLCEKDGNVMVRNGAAQHNVRKNTISGRKMHRKHKNLMRNMIKKIRKELKLTPGQQKEIKAIVGDYRQKVKEQKMRARMARKKENKIKRRSVSAEISHFITPQGFDKTAFRQALEQRWLQQEKRQAQQRKIRLDMMADTMEKIFAVLTPEQRQKLAELPGKSENR
jgi:Spy/CpxP family protein refolding chaperone